MQKSKLDKFISKYNLGGNVNSVKWKSSGDSLSTSVSYVDQLGDHTDNLRGDMDYVSANVSYAF